MDKIIEQDLAPVAETPKEEEAIPLDDLDLEEVIEGDSEEMGEKNYQYILTVRQEGTNDGDKNIEPQFTFILKPKEAEEEEDEGDLEKIESASDEIEGAQAPQASLPANQPAPQPALPESKQSDLIPITEQGEGPLQPENEPVPTTPPAEMSDTAAAPPTEGEEEPELEDDTGGTELSEEELKSFIEQSDIPAKFYIDEETEFNLDEVVDYLKLYPESEIFVTIEGEPEDFQTKLDDYIGKKDEATEEVQGEEQNVMVTNQGQTLDLKNTPQANPANPEVHRESFSIFNFRGKKNLPDGIYLAYVAENKLYGRIDMKLTPNNLIIDKEVFNLDKEVNITEAKGKETIEITLKEEEVSRLLAQLEKKADIIIRL